MAFCTQRKFPGQSYENSGLAEIHKMKVYGSIKDHRAWSIDRNQQTSYLVDAVHKTDDDTVDLQHTMSIGSADCRNGVKKFSKRVGTADVDQNPSTVSQTDSVQIFELSMELEETRLRNSTLKNENSDLRKRIAHIMASDHEHEREDSMLEHLKILEKIIEERNDLRDLLDKFLAVTDQIVELKMQADHMKDMENDFILLQAKCRDQEKELAMLRNERETFEGRIRELEAARIETNSLKESNSKLEKDLVDLSNVISVSDNFIHDQDIEIKTKLHTISELNQQIDNLKMALSEAEMKLNKKLRLEMDVELMEKELSMMIENSAESNPYTQQVVDRQVEDLATAIKLTLGCMNYEFENNEEDNLVEANRQLKALLLESSNKILEFKDVINKQEQSLMKVSNDFACKNDELTECLATVEELKRHLAQHNDVETINVDSPVVHTDVPQVTDDSRMVAMNDEQERFESEMNLAESEYEDDGPEIEDLENIFEKSCSQQDTGDIYKASSGLRDLKQSQELKLFSKVKTESLPASKPVGANVAKSGRENITIKAELGSAEQLRRLSAKIERMGSYINDLESQNHKLKSQIRETSNSSELDDSKNDERDKLKGDSKNATHSHLSNVANVHHGSSKIKVDSADNVSGVADTTTIEQQKIEPKLERDPTENERNVSEAPIASNYKSDERDDCQKTNVDLENASSGTADTTLKNNPKIESKEKLAAKNPTDNQQDICETQVTAHASEDVRGRDLSDLISENEELKNVNEQLLRKISCLERDAQIVHKSMSQMQRDRLSTKLQQFESDLPADDVKRIENENLNLKLENEKLVVEIGKLKNLGNSSHLNVMEMKKDLEKLAAINEQLTAELAAKNLEKDLLLAKEVETMPPDVRDLVLRNEELRKENENLLLKIRLLEAADNSDRCKTTTDTEPDWLPSNEDLVAEIEKLQQSKNKSSLTIRQMEKDLKRMELANENLSVRLSDKEAELRGLSASPDIANILQQNEELKMMNRNLTVEINELKKSENLDRSNEADMKVELEALLNVNKSLQSEIDELKQALSMKTDQQLKNVDVDLLTEGAEPVSAEYNSNIPSILKIGKDLERIAALNESLLALNDTDTDNVHSMLDDMTPDINQLLNRNHELKLANDNLSTKVRELQDTENRAQCEAVETANRLETLAAANEHLQTRIKNMERSSSTDRTTNLHSLRNENENLKTTNVQLTEQIALLEKKLRNIENRTAQYLNDQHPSAVKGESLSMHANDDLSLEIDWMVADMKKLQSRNDNLRSTNEKLLSQISELQACVNHSKAKDETTNVSDKILDNTESDAQLIYACNRNIEMEWMKSDMDALHRKNEKLRSTNDSLVAEIGALKSFETHAQKNIQQMEKDLLKLSAMNERLSTQLNEKKVDQKHLLKVRSQELETKDLLKKVEELTISNERLASEIAELKSTDSVKMRNDLKRLSSTNDNLKMQIAEMRLLSSNELKMESNWMAADMKKLLNKNKKLNASNQNLLNEINEMHKEFKSLENRANMNALQKVKEIDRLTALNENLKDQLNAVNNERRNCRCNDIGSNCSITDMRKVHKKNEELKAANEKLLSVIINLKNAEKQAISKATEMESELYKLRETNKSLQDTLENYVEKDWSKPKTELERICQEILNDGIQSLNNAELSYMQNWFGGPTATDYDTAKTALKNTTRKHCKVCHNSVEAFGKTCECKHYEEKKRLNLLKEIEETKLAIQHIQKSNDIEFDLNDVKNRLLKAKPSDSSDDDGPYGTRTSQSQENVNVRAHIITKCVKRNHHQPRK